MLTMLGRAGATLLSLLQLRLELAGIEIQEETDRIIAALVFALCGVMLLTLACAFLALSITVLLWETNRLLALVCASSAFLVSGAVLLAVAMHRLKQRPAMFPVSAGQLADDRHAIAKP